MNGSRLEEPQDPGWRATGEQRNAATIGLFEIASRHRPGAFGI
jgi:hypothetical protein